MESSVKESVVEGYSKLAKSRKNGLLSKLFACCDPNENANEVGKVIGYSEEILNSVPKGSNLGVGCGNPSALADIRKGETVIDLGSGAGFDAFIISPIVESNGKVIGVDLSDEMLDLAKENAKKGNYSNVDFIKGDIEKLPLDNNIAEHVISNCVINLSLNKEDVFKEAYRVAKKGGRMMISDIILLHDLPDYVQNSVEGHIACLSGAIRIDDYIAAVSKAGFTDIKIDKQAPFPIELMLNDPIAKKIVSENNLTEKEIQDIINSIASISLSAKKS